MNRRELERRQHELLARSSHLRARLDAELGAWHKPLRLVDHLLGSVNWFGRHPLWGTGALLTLTARRPRQLLIRVLKAIWLRAVP